MMQNKKTILAIAILFAVIFSSFAAKKEKAPKQAKQMSSADFVYFTGVKQEDYIIRHVGFDFTAFWSGGKNLPKILNFGSTKGYSFPSVDTEKGIEDIKLLWLLCNIFSEMDGLEPAYKKMDGSPAKNTEDLKEFIYTMPACGGWYLPANSRFYISKITSRPEKAFSTNGFESGCGAWQYYVHTNSSGFYMSMGFSMKRSVSAQGKTIPVKSAKGSFSDRYYVKPFEVAIIDSATILSIFADMAKNGYSVSEKNSRVGNFVGPNGNLSVRDLGINDEIFCNMLSEALGYVPVYYDYDGNVYKKAEEGYYDRKFYEQHTNGWRKPTSNESAILRSANIGGIFFVRNTER